LNIIFSMPKPALAKDELVVLIAKQAG